MSRSNWETNCTKLLAECSILSVIAIQINDFTLMHGTAPQMVILSRQLKSPLIREVYRQRNIPPKDSIIEPIWLGNVPLVFANLPDCYIKVSNNSIRKELCL